MKPILAVTLMFVAFFTNAQKGDGEFHLDKDYAVNSTGTINLTCSDAKVYITGSQRKTAHIKIDRIVITKGITFGSHDEFSVDISEEAGDLEIKEHGSYVAVGMIGYHYEKYTIIIEAPEGTSLKVKGDDGDYSIKNINGAISLRLDDADVDMTQCSGNKFTIKLDDGDVTMDEASGSFEFDGDDADVTIKNASFTFVDARIDDGDLIIETSLSDKGEYRIDAQDGMVSFAITKGGGKFNIHHDDGRISTEGDFSTEEESDNTTRLALASGSAKVDIRADDARVKLIKR